MAYQKQIYQDGITEYTDTLFEHMDDGIFGAYPVQLIAISDTAPSQCVENDKYYNTSTKKIYTATGTNTWGTNGETPLEDTAYWLISENGSYAWNGTDLVSIGGGKAEVVISDEEPEEGKLWVDTAEIQTIAGRDRLVNVSNEIDEDYRVNVLYSKNLFDGQLEQGTFNTSGNKQSDTTLYRNKNIIPVKPNTTYTFSIDGVSQKYCLFYYTNAQTFISYDFSLTTGTFTTPANCYFINFRCFQADYTDNYANLDVQLQEGSTATSYEPYVTPAIYVDNEEIYSKPVVLWTNPNPTSSFASQSITLFSDDYNHFEIIYSVSNYTDYDYRKSSGIIPFETGKKVQIDGIDFVDSSLVGLRRIITETSKTSFAISNNKLMRTSSLIDNNIYIIPLKIIGYK